MEHKWNWSASFPSFNGEYLGSVYFCSTCKSERQVKRKLSSGDIVEVFGSILATKEQEPDDQKYLNKTISQCKGIKS